MKHNMFFKMILFSALLILFSFYGCEKEPDPLALTTVSASAITYLSAISGGNITADGGAAITARGVCWGISQYPTTGDSKTEDGAGTGTYSSKLTGLTPGTVYYVRAYASNSEGSSGSWWTSTTSDNIYVWQRKMQSDISDVKRYESNKNFGFSVRCIMDK